jgi:beta-lactamase class C
VKKLLPEFDIQNDEYEQQITLHHILNQSTGLPVHAYTVLLDDNVPYEQIKPLLCSIPSIGPPGKYYSYQNVAYSLVADMMQVKTGKDYSTLLREKLFGPLGMSDASSDYQSMVDNANTAKPHVRLRNGNWLTEDHNNRYYSVGPAAGVNASIYDLTYWVKSLLAGFPEVVDTSVLSYAFHPHIDSHIKWKYKKSWKQLEKAYYGLGWRVFDYGEKKVIFHSGYVRGFKAEIALMPEDNLGMAVIFNGASHYCNKVIPDFFDSYLDFQGKDLPNPEIAKH